MKLKLAVLREPLNVGDMAFNGVMSLGSGMSRGRSTALADKEQLELVDGDLVKVTHKSKVIYIPVHNFRYIIAAD